MRKLTTAHRGRVPGVKVRAIAFILLATTCLAEAFPQVVLTFKDSCKVNDTLFALGDIAVINCDDASLRQELVNTFAGISAPPSFGRFITVEDFVARELRHRYTKVSFVCKGSPRPYIGTAHRTVTVKSYEHLIGARCDSAVAWQKGTWQYTVKNSSDSLQILNNDTIVAEVTGFSEPFLPKGNVNLWLVIRQCGREYRTPLHCNFTVRATVVIAERTIMRGEMITSAECVLTPMDLTHFTPNPKTVLSAVVGMRAARSINKGTIFHDRVLSAIPAVEKGDLVSIVHLGRGLSIAVSGTAREDGYTGEKIWVENSATNKLIRAEILEKGKVAITSGRNKS